MSPALAPVSAGWHASLALGFRRDRERTVLAERRRQGPLAVQRPFYPEGEVCHLYLLHPPGGVVGGDRLSIEARVDAGAEALVTTPGATKFYRSAGSLACQVQRLRVGEGACLEWLPQENIFFPGARVLLETELELTEGARFALWELNSLGRPANDEGFDSGELELSLSIVRDGYPLLLERLRVDARSRRFRSGLAAQPVTGTLVMGPADAPALALARECIARQGEERCGATLVDDLLVLRCLGESTERARRLFGTVWAALRQSVLGRPAVPPRIWAT